MSEEMIKEALGKSEDKMEKVIGALKENLKTIRTGRANPALLDSVMVDYYGTPTPIKQVANISAPEPSLIVVQPWDKGSLKDIEKGIQSAELGLNPSNDGTIIRVPIPQLTEDRRKELAKDAQKYGEEAKVAIRNVRRDANDAIKKDKELPEDEKKQTLEESQKLTDKYIKDVDSITETKKKEILNV